MTVWTLFFYGVVASTSDSAADVALYNEVHLLERTVKEQIKDIDDIYKNRALKMNKKMENEDTRSEYDVGDLKIEEFKEHLISMLYAVNAQAKRLDDMNEIMYNVEDKLDDMYTLFSNQMNIVLDSVAEEKTKMKACESKIEIMHTKLYDKLNIIQAAVEIQNSDYAVSLHDVRTETIRILSSMQEEMFSVQRDTLRRFNCMLSHVTLPTVDIFVGYMFLMCIFLLWSLPPIRRLKRTLLVAPKDDMPQYKTVIV